MELRILVKRASKVLLHELSIHEQRRPVSATTSESHGSVDFHSTIIKQCSGSLFSGEFMSFGHAVQYFVDKKIIHSVEKRFELPIVCIHVLI